MKQLQMIKTKFFQSFKLDKRFFSIVLIDLAYYAILYISFVIFVKNAIPKIVVVNKAKDLIGLLTNETLSMYQSDLATIQEARSNLTMYGIILLIVFILSFSCFKLWIWHLFVKRKYRITLLAKGIVVNTIFFMVILLLALAGFYILKTEIFLVWLLVLLPISIYFLNWVHPLFSLKGNIKTICQGIHLGIKRFFHLLVPYLIIIILLFLLILGFRMFNSINPKIYWPIFLLCLTIFLNWAKHLLYIYKKGFFPK